jgi:hypothetical protein
MLENLFHNLCHLGVGTRFVCFVYRLVEHEFFGVHDSVVDALRTNLKLGSAEKSTPLRATFYFKSKQIPYLKLFWSVLCANDGSPLGQPAQVVGVLLQRVLSDLTPVPYPLLPFLLFQGFDHDRRGPGRRRRRLRRLFRELQVLPHNVAGELSKGHIARLVVRRTERTDVWGLAEVVKELAMVEEAEHIGADDSTEAALGAAARKGNSAVIVGLKNINKCNDRGRRWGVKKCFLSLRLTALLSAEGKKVMVRGSRPPVFESCARCPRLISKSDTIYSLYNCSLGFFSAHICVL